MKWVASILRKVFPQVRHLSLEDFRDLLNRASHLIIVDVREPEEFTVSHLPSAILYTESLIIPKDTPVILYCSAGYRSARVAKRLARLGYNNVSSLDGGIFGWANAGLPLQKGGEDTMEVHPYNAFGKLLLKKHKPAARRKL